MRTQLVKGLLIGLSGVWFASAAWALEPCGDIVVDTAEVLRDIPAIEAAAAELARETGAEVRVRITSDYAPQANLDRHVEAVADTVCESWTSVDGSRRPNLVIFWVTMDREVGLYYGNQWERPLRAAWPTMLEHMKPHLRASDFDQAFVTAIDEARDVIAGATAPLVTRQPAPAPIVVSSPAVPAQPIDLVPLFKVLGMLVAAAVAGIGFKIYLGHQATARREEEQLRVAQQSAMHNQNLSTEGFETLNRLDAEVVAARETVATLAAAKTLAAWDVAYHEMSQEGLGIRDRFKAAPDARQSGLTKGEYAQAGGIHKELASELQVAIKKFEAVLKSMVEVKALAGSIPNRFEAQKAQVPSVWQSIATIKANGYVTSAAEAFFVDAENILQQAHIAIAAQDWQLADDRLDDAATMFEQATVAATELPESFLTLSNKMQTTAVTLGTFAQHQRDAKAAYSAMESRYDSASFESVHGNGSEAEIRYLELSEKYNTAKAAVVKKDVTAGEALLREVIDDWDDVVVLLLAVTQLRERLDAVSASASIELVEAKRSVGAARDYLAQHRAHATSKHEADLQRAIQLIAEADTWLAINLVPVTKVLELATTADALADEVLSLAEDSVTTERRQIERANRLRQEIPDRLTEVGSYLRNHRGDLDSEFDGRVRDLEQELARVSRTADTAAFLAKAAAITAALDALYAASRQRVEAAETARRRRREEEERQQRQNEEAAARRRRTASVSRSSTSTFGGGSSSFGSSSRGFGGGSSKW